MTVPVEPRPTGAGPQVMISCGEASGDLYAAALVRELRAADPRVTVWGVGGPRLAATGADLVADYRGISVTGLVEAASVLPRSWRLLRTLGDAARARRPDVFVAIDFPDFNFRLLPPLAAAGVPIVYYVSPQLWAWRAGRLATLRRFVKEMLVIFPFERELYQRAGMAVEFIGHPLADLIEPSRPRDEWLAAHGLSPARPLVALLPGSRPNELHRILPVLARSIDPIRAQVPGTQFVVARAPALDDALFDPIAAIDRSAGAVAIVTGETDDALAAADVVITASGTATVQTALHGKPMVIVYALSPLTYAIGRAFVRVQSYGMVNLVAGRPIVPELIQGEFTVDGVTREAVSLLTDGARRESMRRDLSDVRDALGTPGASARAAAAVLRVAAAATTLART